MEDANCPNHPAPPGDGGGCVSDTTSGSPGLVAGSASAFYVPTQDERTYATLAHALQMPGWWIAPLVILLTKRESRFVKFHATQVLLLQLFHFALIITTMVVFFAVIFASIARAANTGVQRPEPPAALFVFMPFMWLIMFGMYVLVLVLTILYSIKAGKGEWANYPLLGQLARYILNL